MKKQYYYLILIITTIISSLIFVGCTDESIRPLYSFTYSDIAMQPKMSAYSNNHIWNANQTRGSQDTPFWNGQEQVKPNDITEEELNVVVEYFKTHQYKNDEVNVNFSHFYVQQVYYSDEDFFAKDGNKYTAMNCVGQINTKNCDGDILFSGYDSFNKSRFIFDSSTSDFWFNNMACGIWVNNYKMVYIPNYGYYVGFDVEGKTEEDAGANMNQIITNNPDGWYYDRIIKIIPADEMGNIVTLPNDEETNEGNDNNEGEIILKGKDEVEINLSLNTKNDDLLESHLSIHVRANTDVEVFLPIPSIYYCEKDDMEIVMKHLDGAMIHGGDAYKTEYNINRTIVSLNVKFEPNGIRIWTNGITQDVIDYCWDTYQDGITFEIWNYFNDPNKTELLTIDELKAYLDKSTVKFLDNVPNKYINAFGRENSKYGEDNKDGFDFHVIPSEQLNEFYEVTEGEHLNGSNSNEIYLK